MMYSYLVVLLWLIHISHCFPLFFNFMGGILISISIPVLTEGLLNLSDKVF